MLKPQAMKPWSGHSNMPGRAASAQISQAASYRGGDRYFGALHSHLADEEGAKRADSSLPSAL
jgi:hypothetical protein